MLGVLGKEGGASVGFRRTVTGGACTMGGKNGVLIGRRALPSWFPWTRPVLAVISDLLQGRGPGDLGYLSAEGGALTDKTNRDVFRTASMVLGSRSSGASTDASHRIVQPSIKRGHGLAGAGAGAGTLGRPCPVTAVET